MEGLKDLQLEDDKHSRRKILFESFKVANLFEFLFSAMYVTPDAPFWNTTRTQEVLKMLEVYDYEEPDDLKDHLEKTKKKTDKFDLTVAVASRGLRSKCLIKQIYDGVRFMMKYKKDQIRATTQSRFFMTVVKKKVLLRMTKFSELNIVKRKLRNL